VSEIPLWTKVVVVMRFNTQKNRQFFFDMISVFNKVDRFIVTRMIVRPVLMDFVL